MDYKVISLGSWMGLFGGDKYKLKANECIQTGITGFDIETEYIKLDNNGFLTVYAGYE